MAKFKKYIKEKAMSSTMIGFGIDSAKIDRLAKYLESWFIRYKVPYENIDHKHISIAQITDKARKDELVRIVNKISPQPFEFKIKKITVLHGRAKWDFMALELRRSEEYLKLHEWIKDMYNVVEFPGGMKPHISLIKMASGIASDEFMADIIRDAPVPRRVRAKKVELWSPKFQVDYSKKR